MEQIKINGFVIKETSYGETSKILTIITKEKGIISVMSKGSKRLKSTLRCVSEKFSYANFCINYKDNKMSILTGGDIINPLLNIKKDILKIAYVNFICELTYQVLKQNNSKTIYDIFINSILKIEEGFDSGVITNILELKYLKYLGVSPVFDGCVVCGNNNVVTLSSYKGGFVCKEHIENEYIVSTKTIKLIKLLEYVDILMISKIDIKEDIKKEIDAFINEYYDRYTGLYLKSKDFLKKINMY